MSDPNTKTAPSDASAAPAGAVPAAAARPAAPAPDDDPDELLPEYDLRGAVRGKYAARYAEGTNLMPLDPDVAAAFPDHREANAVLRAVAGLIRAHRPAPGADRAGSDAAAA